MGHKARDSGGKFVLLLLLYHDIGLLFGKRLDLNLFGFENIRIRPSKRYLIRCGFIFPLLRADLKISEFAVEFTGCVWTAAVSGEKKLRIQKHLDTCGRGLR